MVGRTTMVGWATAVFAVAAGAGLAASAVGGRPSELVSPAPEMNPKAVVWRTPEPPSEPQAGDVWVNPRDGMELVYVPKGPFTLGLSKEQAEAWLKEHWDDMPFEFAGQQPQCRVDLAGYWIGRTEVTNAQYERFVQATGHGRPHHWEHGGIPAGLEQFPVVNVDWDDALAYCKWAGGHLPTELQWEKAARGTDGRLFPWGNVWDKTRCRNGQLIPKGSAGGSAEMAARDPTRNGPVRAGSFPAGRSPYGCFDMAGNVSEWAADLYDGKAYQRYAKGDLRPPTRSEPGPDVRVLRGGEWGEDEPKYFLATFRDATASRWLSDDRGFRCAR